MKTEGEPQHGYGRTVEWDTDYTDSGIACLSHRQEFGYYDGLTSEIAFSIREDKRLVPIPCFDTILRLTNNSSSLRRIPVSPGFHPYFNALTGFQDLDTDSAEIYLEGMLVNEGRWRAINLGNREGAQIGLLSFNLTEAVQWTDRLADYVCVEPVLSTCGLLGDKDKAKYKSITLEPERSHTFHVRITAGRLGA